ncbi:hypothetical protein EHQ16_11460 [Leptospira kanakyensis]|uniref:Transmembrane protein n=1 Tax=Leptospira kanakyensis TaxID=2484968 RepID=A0A6N4QD27_9LEPT|nr:hypothetical protein [Leptospira kanakyensis]TGK54562.1 hypothetical protein EHQ11_03155 [Leptospira kanakyensis]TGK58970.1 hypothetical protein EHQ16_11460 [Leptospira kanakyensis]TGK75121.1 hypothetical protein EHQ18_02135 [Leptospira kanakyensis]
MKQKRNILKTNQKFVSWILFFSFVFVFFCSAGIVNCPKIGFDSARNDVEVQSDFTFPCHNPSDGEENSNQTNPCQCLEDSKSQEVSNQLTLSKLLQISFYILFYTPSVEPILVLSENQKHWKSFLVFEADFPNQQKTIKLLI